MTLIGRVREESGESLFEIMVTIAIMGIVMVGLVAGIGTAIRLSGLHRTQASAGVALATVAEAVKTFAAPTATCETMSTATYAGALTALTGTALPPRWVPANLSIASASCVTVNGVKRARVRVVATTPDGLASGTKTSEAVDVVRRSVT